MKKLIPALFLVSVLFIDTAHAEPSLVGAGEAAIAGAAIGCAAGAAGTGLTMGVVGYHGPGEIFNASVSGCKYGAIVGGVAGVGLEEAYAKDAPSESQLNNTSDEE